MVVCGLVCQLVVSAFALSLARMSRTTSANGGTGSVLGKMGIRRASVDPSLYLVLTSHPGRTGDVSDVAGCG